MTAGVVTIGRDAWGVPHIRADDEAEGFFGIGYAQAEDNLPLLLRSYLALRGELAATFGADVVPSDRHHVRWRHLEEARRALPLLCPQLRANYRAFIAGVAHFLRTHPDEVPPWAPPLEPALPLALLRQRAWWFAIEHGLRACERAGVALDPLLVEELAWLAEPAQGSNAWAVAGWRTASGATMHAADPHARIGGDYTMWEVCAYPGELAYAAVQLVGHPLPLFGHTRDVAWGYTVGPPLGSVCHAVTTVPGRPETYLLDGEPHGFETHEHTLAVAGADAVTLRFRATWHNQVWSPVVAEADGAAYVVSSPWMHVPHLLDQQLYDWLRARDVAALREAMRPLGHFGQTVVAADRSGGLFAIRVGRVPRLPEHCDPSVPLPGNSRAAWWSGLLRLDELAQARDPAWGVLHAENGAPDTMLPDVAGTSLHPDATSAAAFNDRPGRRTMRGRRAAQRLDRGLALTVEEFVGLALDTTLLDVDRWQEALVAALVTDPSRVRAWPQDLRRFVHDLLAFDGATLPESRGALAYLVWREHLPGMTEPPPPTTVLLDALEQAATALRAAHGRLGMALGDVFRVGRGEQSWPGRGVEFRPDPHPDPDGLAQVGTVAPLRTMAYGPPDAQGRRWAVSGGRSLRVVAFTEPVSSFAVTLFGQSGRADSPHYGDQARLFSEGRVRPTGFDDLDVVVGAVTRLRVPGASSPESLDGQEGS